MRRTALILAGVLAAGAATLFVAAPASAHVVPSTTLALDVHESDITASVVMPADDLAAASGIDVGGEVDTAESAAIENYLEVHTTVTTGTDDWAVAAGDVALIDVEQWGTGQFGAITATLTLTPPTVADLRTFTIAYDAIIHQVVTADIYVTLHSDWSAGQLDSARNLGAIEVDTVTGTVAPLSVDLDGGSLWQGFTGMVGLGVSHIAEGTDHQLFLLTLLLPAPLLAIGGRWRGPIPTRNAVRRIIHITLAFTVGHSITLALGALGLPVPQQAVEALIAVSILIAAAHAIRPIFPGREAVVAGVFGLVHGLAFSTTLQSLDLSGGQLALSLLGFNLGIELMQLAVVVLALPALIVLARTRGYTPLRMTAAVVTGVAAIGWLVDRLGFSNPLADAAEALGPASSWVVAALCAAAGIVVVRRSRERRRAAERPTEGWNGHRPLHGRGRLVPQGTPSVAGSGANGVR